MVLKPVLAGTFKLDGGAMFGVVPRRIWEKLIPPDNQNLCTWALRCLYLETGHSRILIDTGLGNKQSDKFYSYYEPSGDVLITDALIKQRIQPESISDIILTHLHFDHVGGALARDQSGIIYPLFPNATVWVMREHWQYALQPNAREKASFLTENINPLQALGILRFLDESEFTGLEFIKVDGHTRAMALPLIHVAPGKKLLFSADLFPSVHHLPLPYIMAYDMQPLITLKEKEDVLNRCLLENIALFFEHDVDHEVAILKKNESGKAVADATCTLNEWLSKTQ
ncbi:MAG: MBL fold metallo-hydrolase [Saprospiraceae bacterium]|nr:MBL fold metallo-hydrolase [Saprospiraceae bacterium]